jgi:hypothetical protein
VLKADPSCGKSVLASAVVQKLEEEGSGDNTTEVLLTEILHQLLSSHEVLLDEPVKGSKSISDYMLRNAKALPDRMVDVLWDILKAATDFSRHNEIGMICILDGMHACEAHADQFSKIADNYLKGSHPRIKFLITTRSGISSFSSERVSFNSMASCRMIDLTRMSTMTREKTTRLAGRREQQGKTLSRCGPCHRTWDPVPDQ